MENGHQYLRRTASPVNVSQLRSTLVSIISQQVWIWVSERGKQSGLNVRITPLPNASLINKLLSLRRTRTKITILIWDTWGRSLRCSHQSHSLIRNELRLEAQPWHPSAERNLFLSRTIIHSLRDPRIISLNRLLSWSSRPWWWWANLKFRFSLSRKQAWYHRRWPQLTIIQPRRSKSILNQLW